MKQIYRLAQNAFEALGLKQPPGKAYQMGFVDGYLIGFREARHDALVFIDRMGEKEEEPKKCPE